MDVIYKYLDCGDPHFGFARIKGNDCKHEYILPFSCKRRHFCPSCYQKRVVEFGEHLNEEVLEKVQHRQWVFSIPRRLRPYFMYDRKLLAKLSLCAWKVLSEYLKTGVSLNTVPEDENNPVGWDPVPGAVIAVQTFQTFGEFLNFNPHLHIIATDGCFYGERDFVRSISPNAALSYLKQLPITKFKIDKSFIDSICSDESRTLTGQIVKIGKNMGMAVITEGVENQEQLEYLIKHECHKIQGYFFGKPISENEVEKLLEI